MKIFSAFRLLLTAIVVLGAARILSATTVLWVSPAGSDAADGTEERPFATLPRAKTALRELVQKGLTDDVAIRLRGGVHRLTETLEFTPEDMGDGRYQITLSGMSGERAVIAGSRPLPSEWRQVTAGLWVLSLPEARAGRWIFRSLFRADASLPRAREPDVGHYTVAEVADERRRLILNERLPAAWSALAGVELNTTAHWHFSRQPLAEISETGVLASRGIGTDVSSSRITAKSHSRVWLENALVIVDEPREWLHDYAAGEQ